MAPMIFMLTTYCICRKKYIALKENVTQEILAHERLTTIYFKRKLRNSHL